MILPSRPLGEGPVAFDPGGGALAWAAGRELHLVDPEGATRRLALPLEARSLCWGPGGALWVIGGLGVALLRGGEPELLSAELEADELLEADEAGARWVARGWLDGVGAVGVLGRVSREGEITREEPEPGGVRALARSEGACWTARAPAVDGALRAREHPTLEHHPALGRPLRWPVLGPGEEPTGIAAWGDRALVAGRSGAWELWRVGARAPLAAGVVGWEDLRPVPLGPRVALGRALVELGTGAVRPDALPAPARAASPDGRRWVLGLGAASALWSAP